MKIILLLLLFCSCNPIPVTDLLGTNGAPPPDEIVDFVPALQPFVNEGCNTGWDNVSAINTDGGLIYFVDLPAYTANPNDLDKSRFTFIIQSRNPWYGIFEDETPYSHVQTGWYTLPVDDYGGLTCMGLQEIRTWVLDELTDRWYMNSQVCWAAVLCNGQVDCDQGYSFGDIEFADYSAGFNYLQTGSLTEY